jgi:NAD+ diphosphatase
MIQDIAPHKMYNQFQKRKLVGQDSILLYSGKDVLCREADGQLEFPSCEWLSKQKFFQAEEIEKNVRYFFSIDEDAYYGIPTLQLEEADGYEFMPIMKFREKGPLWKVYAGAVGGHLNHWYQLNRYCGRCGALMHPCTEERAMQCTECHNIVYPRISPAVIVAVMDGNRILMTKYAGRVFKKYALIAGYAEIGETLEETVRREVMEEVGLKVKNIRYYKSQPWAFDDSLLSGFFCELDGSDQITLEEDELSMAEWFERDKMPDFSARLSLTNEMMKMFQEGKV